MSQRRVRIDLETGLTWLELCVERCNIEFMLKIFIPLIFLILSISLRFRYTFMQEARSFYSRYPLSLLKSLAKHTHRNAHLL